MQRTFINLAKQVINRLGLDVVIHHPSSVDPTFPKDFDPRTIDTIRKIKPYTMTSKNRLSALCDAVRYVVAHQIPGDIVECGVWKGGSMMAVADTLIGLQDYTKHLYLFDTFDGMTEPGEQDVSTLGEPAKALLKQSKKEADGSVWCYAPLEAVKQAVYQVGYPEEKTHFVQGRVEDTIPKYAPERIALLRLDTDWYQSTLHEMIHLFPRISVGGVIIIDDYGWWQGAKQAVDEYIQQKNIQIFLNRIDSTGRLGIVTSHGDHSQRTVSVQNQVQV